MDAYLAPLAGLTIIRGADYRVEHSTRAEDAFYARYDADARFYDFMSRAIGSAVTSLGDLVARLRNSGGALSSPRHLAPRN